MTLLRQAIKRSKDLSTALITRSLSRSVSTQSKLRLPNALTSISRSGLLFVAGTSLAGGLSLALYDRTSGSINLGNSFSSSAPKMSYPVQKSDEEWRAQLSPEQFRILRKKGTEMAGTGEYDKQYPDKGVFNCAGCDAPLYNYDSKFKSGCGWPAFFEEIEGTVVRHTDRTFGMERTEIVCANCGGHLGHVFKGEKFGHPKDERHCVNSISIKYAADAKPESS